MKKFLVASLVAAGVLSIAGVASAHPHTIEQTKKDAAFADNPAFIEKGGSYFVTIANGSGHPGFDEVEEGYYVSSGFDTYVEGKHASANSGYGMETAHHGPDLGTPGKADDAYAQDGPTGKPSPDDDNPALQ